MQPQDWVERWREGRTPFHLDEVNPWLVRFADRLALGAGSRVLVPLCGKTLDMAYLADRGAHVTGVDVARQALQAFAAEQGITLEEQRMGDVPVLLSASYRLLAADILALSGEELGVFDAVWDRAALVALPPHIHPVYVKKIMGALRPGGHLLLVNLEYDEERMDGPPYSVPHRQVEDLFRSAGDITLLGSKEIPREHILRRDHELTSLTERAFLVTRPA